MTVFSMYLVGLLLLALGVDAYSPWLKRAGGTIMMYATLLALLT
ncbi:hypothetical protein [Chromobacterium fluminis]|nr:hypothetical protein [Chromobacterium haemolyticum]